MKTRTVQFEVEDHDNLSDLVIRLGRYDSQCTYLNFRIIDSPPAAQGALSDEQINEALKLHHLTHDTPSQLADSFRAGVHYREQFAAQPAPIADSELQKQSLAVWFGSMPESNGKQNWTAILHKGDIYEGFTIAVSEYKDRVRYDADCVKYMIGEITTEPQILDYDGDLQESQPLPAPTQQEG